MSLIDVSPCHVEPNNVAKEDKFYHHFWEKWPEEVLADHMRGLDFVFKMLSLFPLYFIRFSVKNKPQDLYQ